MYVNTYPTGTSNNSYTFPHQFHNDIFCTPDWAEPPKEKEEPVKMDLLTLVNLMKQEQELKNK